MVEEADIVIVGAGIIGATLAWGLRDSGLDVSVVDRAEPGGATTASTFAWMNASSKVRRGYGPDYVRFSTDGWRDAYELALEIPGDWMHVTGNLEVVAADQAAALEADVRRLVGQGYLAQYLDPERLAARYPELVVDEGSAAAWYPDEGWIDGPALITDIAGRLDGGNVSFRTGDVVGFDQDSGSARVTSVRLASGERIRTGQVVVTAGVWTADVAALAGVTVPMVAPAHPSVPGLVARATAPADGLRHQIMSGDDFVVRPHRPGEIMLTGEGHGLELTADTSPEEALRGAEALLTVAAKTVPALRDCDVTSATVCLRALPADGVSITGADADVPNLYAAVTHSGISLAPTLGKFIAAELLSGRSEEALEPFRLARFR
ncbi:NAD(P)/FAD-dependent oxidoreductase [Streptomyces chartreusis]